MGRERDERREGERSGRRGAALVAGLLRATGLAAALALPALVLWERRETVFGSAEVATRGPADEPGWATILLGAPSGAPARELPLSDDRGAAAAQEPTDSRQDSEPSGAPRAAAGSTPTKGRASNGAFLPALLDERRPAPDADTIDPTIAEIRTGPSAPRVPDDFELRVAPNMTLGEIAQIYYDTAHPKVVRALASYNGLSNPDRLRTGQTLWVPDRSKLGVD